MANTRVRDSRKSEMTRTADSIEAEISKVFPDIETKYGYKLKFNGGSFDGEGNLKLRIECLKNGAKSTDAQRYEHNHVFMGLPPLTAHVSYINKDFEIVGMNTTGTKVKATWMGRTYLLPVELVKALWVAQKP